LAVLVLVFSVLCQTRVDIVILDTYEIDTAPLVLFVATASLPQTLTASTQGTDIVGGERDLILTGEDGPNNSILTAGVSAGEWSVAAPHSSSGFATMQYDGVDGSSTLNKAGLALDLETNGADALHLVIQADQETKYTVTLYSGSSTSEFVVDIPGDESTHDYYIKFSDFKGGVDINNVGAIEVTVDMFVDVDAFISLFATAGPTTTPPPPPGVSPPPPAVATLWYTFDDDDEGKSPCGDEEPRKTFFLADDNIIYYYFYGLPNDPEDGASSLYLSGAETLTGSIVLLVGAFFALI